MNVAELVRFKNDLDLSPEVFAEMTGLNFNRIRRGRVPDGFALAQSQVDVIGRARRLYELASGLCGTREAALEWMYAPAPALGQRSPIELTMTSIAFARVERLIATLKAAAQPSAAAPASGEPSPPQVQAAPVLPLEDAKSKIADTAPVVASEGFKANATVHGLASTSATPIGLETKSGPKPDAKFRIAERLKQARARDAALTKAEIARRMVASGVEGFTGAKLGRYEIGYEASWREITALASILKVTPTWLIQTE
jgi:hypothetical protein